MHVDMNGERTMIATARQRGERRPWLQLLSAVIALGGGHCELLRHSQTAWASVTFSGTRHTIALLFKGAESIAAGEAFVAVLPDHEFVIPRQIVADAAIVSVGSDLLPEPQMLVELEILLLEDC